MVGILIITQAETQLPKPGARGFGRIMSVVTVIRELGLLLPAFMVVSCSMTAIATELGDMSVARDGVAFRLMEIQVGRFISMPRITGCTR
ncbi:MAG: putative transporter, permease component [Nitrospira sp.]|jgi:ABC-type transporter Mla maintaining outer membrane lipid asymmetry permease subunit MlaE|nr:putative transporter, permease component [Nitrospira sp.]